MEGLKRTCVAKALAVFAVASVTTGSFAQTTETTPVIKGVEDFVGLTPDQVKAAAVDKGTFSFEDKAKVVFLYNVKTGKFINVGGYWGTCTDLHEYGKAMWVNVNGDYLRFAVDNVNDTGNCLGYVFATANERDRDVFVDRGSDADKASSSNWTIEPISGDAKNTVKISTTITSVPPVTDKEDYTDQLGKKYYLSANPNNDDTNVSCSAYEEGTVLDGNDEWRIFTYDQIYKAQKDGIVDNMKNALDLSFRLKSPTFDRHDGDIQYWNTYDFKTKDLNKGGFAKFGLEKYYVTSAMWDKNAAEKKWEAGYKFNYGTEEKAFADVQEYQCYLAKYFCGSITGKCGMVYQDIDITLAGTYVVECKGYSNTTKAKLFAGVLDPVNNDNKMVKGTMNSTMFNQVSNMSAEEQAALHTDDHNMDYAGQAFFDNRKYMNSVVLTVPESAFYKNGERLNSVNIRLGVMTGEYNADADKVEAAADNEWTVFDDFRLQYASTHTAQDLVLDEMRDNLNYIVNGSDKYENTTLHLNKTLTKNKWNSLVLPVSLTKDQLQSAFGANTRLAELKTLTPTAIEFESVKLDDKAYTDLVLDANKPYIIFPERDMKANNSAVYTALLTVDNKTEKVLVPAGHYTIAKVTMVDFSKINKDNWTTMLNGGDGTIKAYGTFARTFGTDAKQDEKGEWTISNKGTIIKDRDNLIGSYFFDKGNMYHSATRPRGLRGFSCWFKPTNNNNAPSVKITLDGVTQSGTTGIEDILADYEQPVSRFANGVYNLNGQLVKKGNSTAGLPSGMYIVGGKKCIVR